MTIARIDVHIAWRRITGIVRIGILLAGGNIHIARIRIHTDGTRVKNRIDIIASQMERVQMPIGNIIDAIG